MGRLGELGARGTRCAITLKRRQMSQPRLRRPRQVIGSGAGDANADLSLLNHTQNQ